MSDWQRIQKLFVAAADLSADEQRRFLDSACAGDAALRAEVEEMLAADSGSAEALSSPVELEAAALLDFPALSGDRIGAYRIEREIGRGGMGAVYLASRDDDQFRKKVAIKVVKGGMDTAEVVQRFRRERQILAGLDHPFIAKMLDGGATPEGRPYLVMDFVEGRPIDAFCRENGLDVRARCRLFVKVAAAVSYAHRSLVVHRDLKPANILVSSDGTPKLLDFGVAKLLDSQGETGITMSPAQRALTPEYASPEQIRGLGVTTATDVYSLGAVLYELLAGRRPHDEASRAELERSICESDPLPPSAYAGDVHRDLDNIVMMAIRREPERRYASVDELARDVERYLTGWPVIARHESVLYRARKFVGRQRLALSATALVALSLIAGVIAASHQATRAEAARRIAEQERTRAEAEHLRADQQRDAAVAESQRAEAEARRARERLTEIVNLSNRSLSEAYAERVSGDVEAREQFLKQTTDLLLKVSGDAANDPSLRNAVAQAYLVFGKLQGDEQTPDRGRLNRALESFRTGAAMLEPIDPASTDSRRVLLWLELQQQMGKLADDGGDVATGRQVLEHALTVASDLVRAHPGSKDAIRSRAKVCHWLSGALELSADVPHALEYTKQAVESLTELARRYPNDAEVLYDLSISETRYGWEWIILNRLEDALPHYKNVVVLRERLVKDHPKDMLYWRALKLSYEHVAGLLGGPFTENLGRPEEGRIYFRKALSLEESAFDNPQNQLLKADHAYFLLRAAVLDPPAGDATQSLAQLRQAAAMYESFEAAAPRLLTYPRELANARLYIGHSLSALGRDPEALAEYRLALVQADRLLAIVPGDQFALSQALAALSGIARSLARSADREGTLAALRDLNARIRIAQSTLEAGSSERTWLTSHVAQSELAAAVVYLALDRRADARKAAQQALSEFRSLAAREESGIHAALIQQAQAVLDQCSAPSR